MSPDTKYVLIYITKMGVNLLRSEDFRGG